MTSPAPKLDPQQCSANYRQRVDDALAQRLPTAQTTPNKLHEAMRYSVLDGGKRVRPLLVYASGEALGCSAEWLDGAACAVELIHAYSLIHDDLPAMDDDALRRGKPTCHIAFGQAMAILAGDALQALAFEVLAADPALVARPQQARDAVLCLSSACGSLGMAGGQAIDLLAVGNTLDLPALQQMHALKTGMLIRSSLEMGGIIAGANHNQLQILRTFGEQIGLAFQIHDDVLDVDGQTQQLGKTSGADIALNKPTFPALLGLTESREMSAQLLNNALQSLNDLPGDTELLRFLAHYIVERSY